MASGQAPEIRDRLEDGHIRAGLHDFANLVGDFLLFLGRRNVSGLPRLVDVDEMLRHGAGTAGNRSVTAHGKGGQEKTVRPKEHGEIAVPDVYIVLKANAVRPTVLTADDVRAFLRDFLHQGSGNIVGGALRDDVDVNREIRRHGGADVLVILYNRLVFESEKRRRHGPDTVRADTLGVFRKAQRLFGGLRADVDIHNHAARRGLDYGFRNQFTLRFAQVHHLARGAAGIQAVDALANQKFDVFFNGLYIHFALLGQRGGHGGDNAVHLFHVHAPPFYFAAPWRFISSPAFPAVPPAGARVPDTAATSPARKWDNKRRCPCSSRAGLSFSRTRALQNSPALT